MRNRFGIYTRNGAAAIAKPGLQLNKFRLLRCQTRTEAKQETSRAVCLPLDGGRFFNQTQHKS
jgi:hypothetical protein